MTRWVSARVRGRQPILQPRLHGADRHGDGGLRRVDHRHAERVLERAPMAGHAGAPHDHDVGAASCAPPRRQAIAGQLGEGMVKLVPL